MISANRTKVNKTKRSLIWFSIESWARMCRKKEFNVSKLHDLRHSSTFKYWAKNVLTYLFHSKLVISIWKPTAHSCELQFYVEIAFHCISSSPCNAREKKKLKKKTKKTDRWERKRLFFTTLFFVHFLVWTPVMAMMVYCVQVKLLIRAWLFFFFLKQNQPKDMYGVCYHFCFTDNQNRIPANILLWHVHHHRNSIETAFKIFTPNKWIWLCHNSFNTKKQKQKTWPSKTFSVNVCFFPVLFCLMTCRGRKKPGQRIALTKRTCSSDIIVLFIMRRRVLLSSINHCQFGMIIIVSFRRMLHIIHMPVSNNNRLILYWHWYWCGSNGSI